MSAHTGGRGRYTPSSQVRNIHLVEVGAAERDVRWTSDHRALRIICEQRNLARRRDLVKIVRGVTGHQQITSCIERRAIRHTVQSGCVELPLPGTAIGENLDPFHIVTRALHDVEKLLIGAQREAVGKSKWPRENFSLAILANPVHPSIHSVEIARVGKIQIALRIEDREIRRLQFAIADAFPGLQDSALAVDADQRRKFGVADVQFLRSRKSQTQIEAAESGNLTQASAPIDAIDLSELSTSPQRAVGIEGEALGMVEPVGEDPEAVERNQRSHYLSDKRGYILRQIAVNRKNIGKGNGRRNGCRNRICNSYNFRQMIGKCGWAWLPETASLTWRRRREIQGKTIFILKVC